MFFLGANRSRNYLQRVLCIRLITGSISIICFLVFSIVMTIVSIQYGLGWWFIALFWVLFGFDCFLVFIRIVRVCALYQSARDYVDGPEYSQQQPQQQYAYNQTYVQPGPNGFNQGVGQQNGTSYQYTYGDSNVQPTFQSTGNDVKQPFVGSAPPSNQQATNDGFL